MLSDYGCGLAIHGGISYTEYTTEELKKFLDSEKEKLTQYCGVEPNSIIYPNHDYNELTALIAGSYFGVCCTGGLMKPIKYDYYCAGNRSNLYTLYRYSLLNNSNTKQAIKKAIDYAMENNMILLPFWHDISLTNDNSEGLTAAEKQELLNYCIEYGIEAGIEFINIGDIPNLL